MLCDRYRVLLIGAPFIPDLGQFMPLGATVREFL